jgi:hypothetical protein
MPSHGRLSVLAGLTFIPLGHQKRDRVKKLLGAKRITPLAKGGVAELAFLEGGVYVLSRSLVVRRNGRCNQGSDR